MWTHNLPGTTAGYTQPGCFAQGLEVIVGLGDLVTFACALALVFSPLASADYSLIIGNVMIANQVWRLLL
jgi:hypothetical protein